jgi:hypothetical protein
MDKHDDERWDPREFIHPSQAQLAKMAARLSRNLKILESRLPPPPEPPAE